jgi:mRNA-degrading endonuclease toxin of MazEF toxin-antitoxin module
VPIKPGEIYFVTIDPTHAVGHEQHGRRPFVIVSRLRINLKNWVVVAVPLTTWGTDRPATHSPHRIFIPASEISRDVAFSGNIEDSLALTDQIRALNPTRLENRMGTLSGAALASVGAGIRYLLDL